MKTKEQLLEQFENLIINNRVELFKNDDVKSCEIDIEYFFDDTESFDELRDNIDNGDGFSIEIIYYSKAIEYLSKNDASLRESLEIAHEFGYTCDNLNSEVLASLLASQNVRQEFEELENIFSDYYEELEKINEAIQRIEDTDEGSEEFEQLIEELENDFDI